MKYTIISGSQRHNSESSKVSGYIKKFLENLSETNEINLIDLGGSPLPLYDEANLADEGADLSALDEDVLKLTTLWSTYSHILENSDAFVVVTPEWNGMATAAIKNFFLYVGTEMAHKPALIVTVSSGLGGAYPAAELRMSSYKNTHICYIPIQVVVREVETVFNNYEINSEDKNDERIKLRINNSLEILESYSRALKLVREDKNVELGKYRYGM